MKQCIKCAIRVDGDAKICRRCGSILEEVDPYDVPLDDVAAQDRASEAAASEDGAATADNPAADNPAAAGRFVPPRSDPDALPDPIDQFVAETFEWQCRGCGETIERQFDTCWKCGTTRDGSALPDFTRETADDQSGDADATPIDEDDSEADKESAEAISTPGRRDCLRCGSDKIITGVNVVSFASGELAAGRLELMALEDHERLLFMGRQARLTADVCGECGHVELRAENVRGLPQRRREHW